MLLCTVLHRAVPPAVLQEAVSTRDLELVQLVLRYRDYQRAIKRLAGIPILLEKLRKVPRAGGALGVGGASPLGPCPPHCSWQAQDFYVEMKWEFTSWGKLGQSGSFPVCLQPTGRHRVAPSPSGLSPSPPSATGVQDLPQRHLQGVEERPEPAGGHHAAGL